VSDARLIAAEKNVAALFGEIERLRGRIETLEKEHAANAEARSSLALQVQQLKAQVTMLAVANRGRGPTA
jgi:chromosome segregation ATPase